jgi:Mitochondrial carrier protein
MFGTIAKISKEEGVLSLWKGVNAAWLREASYTSLRLGLYEPCKMLVGAGDPATATFVKKFLAGSLAGALGSVAGNPFDVLKVCVGVVCVCVCQTALDRQLVSREVNHGSAAVPLGNVSSL